MASLRTCRTAATGLLLVVLATTAIPAAASTRPPDDQARYCKPVDAYRIKSCAEALLPDSPLGRQLRWVLDQLAGEAASLTEAEVRAHFSAEFFAVWGEEMSPEAIVALFRQTIAERGTFSFVGFATTSNVVAWAAATNCSFFATCTGKCGNLPARGK